MPTDIEQDGENGRGDAAIGGPCKLCAGGEMAANLNDGYVDHGVSCRTLNRIVGNANSNTEDCRRLQLMSYLGCGCPSIPDGYCELCIGEDDDIPNPRLPVPILGEEAVCGDVLYVAREDLQNGSCDSLTRASTYCGCPNAPAQSCFACPDGAAMPAADIPLRIPPFYNTTCRKIDELAIFQVTDEQCLRHTSDEDTIAVHVPSFCGCPGAEPPNQCSLCGRGLPLPNPMRLVDNVIGLTCRMLHHDIAPHVISREYCDRIQRDYADDCCTDEPTQSPTLPPTFAPTDEPSAVPTASPSVRPTASSSPSPIPTSSMNPTSTQTSSPPPSSSSSNITATAASNTTTSAPTTTTTP